MPLVDIRPRALQSKLTNTSSRDRINTHTRSILASEIHLTKSCETPRVTTGGTVGIWVVIRFTNLPILSGDGELEEKSYITGTVCSVTRTWWREIGYGDLRQGITLVVGTLFHGESANIHATIISHANATLPHHRP